jgi:hypothetical protein
MQGGKNLILPKEMNANRFFWDAHWLEIWSNHFCLFMGQNGGSVAMDSARSNSTPAPLLKVTTRLTKSWLCAAIPSNLLVSMQKA